MSVHVEQVPTPANGEEIGGSVPLGTEEHQWVAPDGSHTATFGRPRGLISLRIARILGPQQAANPILDMYYKAVAGIRTFDGEPFFEPMSDMQFEAAFQRFGSDEALNHYVNTWQSVMYPDVLEALAEAASAGESPEAFARIATEGAKSKARSPKTRS